MQTSPPIMCSINGHADAILKVSAIYRSGIAESQGGGLDGSIGSGISVGVNLSSKRAQTLLSKALTPPGRPAPYLRWLIFAYGVSISILLIVSINFGADLHDTHSVSQVLQDYPAILPLTIFFGFLFLFTLFFDTWYSGRSHWDEQKRLWNQLYYCFRHDVVFLPGEEAVSIEEMNHFLRQFAASNMRSARSD